MFLSLSVDRTFSGRPPSKFLFSRREAAKAPVSYARSLTYYLIIETNLRHYSANCPFRQVEWDVLRAAGCRFLSAGLSLQFFIEKGFCSLYCNHTDAATERLLLLQSPRRPVCIHSAHQTTDGPASLSTALLAKCRVGLAGRRERWLIRDDAYLLGSLHGERWFIRRGHAMRPNWEHMAKNGPFTFWISNPDYLQITDPARV